MCFCCTFWWGTAINCSVVCPYLERFVMQGLDISDKGLDLVSNVIRRLLNIECAVLMGANIAPEVAKEEFCEATIG